MDEAGFLDVAAALRSLSAQHGQGDLLGRWEHRHPLNVPGPLYAADAGNSGPGPLEAPHNILVDTNGFPFLFRQPTTMGEVRQVLLAAHNDPFSAYGADGDVQWTLASVRAWWRQHADLEQLAAAWREEFVVAGASSATTEDYDLFAALARWSAYVRTGLEHYLRVYAFFLEEGRIPLRDDRLPAL